MIKLSQEALRQLGKPPVQEPFDDYYNTYTDKLKQLAQIKEKGMLPSWDSISKEAFESLILEYDPTNQFLADLFGVSKGQVEYRKKKFGLKRRDVVYESFMKKQNDNKMLTAILRQDLKECSTEDLANATVSFLFQDTPVKIQPNELPLKKHIADRLATLITLLRKEDYLRLLLYLESFQHDNYEPEVQIQELDNTFKDKFLANKK